MRWSKYQPKDGDRIEVCVHLEETDGNAEFHWFYARMNGENYQWFCVCEECARMFKSNSFVLKTISKRWSGNEPIIPDLSN